MAWEYSEKMKQLFLDAVHGKPGTHLGEIENPDGLGEHGSIACGDAMRFTFRVERDPADATQDVIVEARYLTFGCTSAIASSEALCTLIEQGRHTPIDALQIRNTDIVDFLGGLSNRCFAETAATWKLSTSRTRSSTAGWRGPAMAVPAPARPCACWLNRT